MLILLLAIPSFEISALADISQTWSRDSQLEIPLKADFATGNWGEIDRKADHAVVAINSAGDVLEVCHTDRNTYAPPLLLKQVEFAFFEFAAGPDRWTLLDQKVIGSVNHSPLLQFYPQVNVKCERPDVVAVGDWFFAVWTRIYDRNGDGGILYGLPGDQTKEPAVLECAWIKKSGGTTQVYTNGLPAGLGFELDRDISGGNFWARECAGCPDAVVLSNPPGGPWTVGVVYPHQTKFGDFNEQTGSPGGDSKRRFELRFLLCTINSAGVISVTHCPPIVPSVAGQPLSGIRFDGPADAAGLILPDVAPGSVPWRFGLAYEEQFSTSAVTSGRIQLQTWDATDATGLVMLESHSFGDLTTPAFMRRANISSYPSAFPGEDVFAIAFGRKVPGGDADVIYEEWSLTNGAHQISWNPGLGWDNDGDDRKPVPLLGRQLSPTTHFGRSYADRAVSPTACDLLKYDLASDTRVQINTFDGLQRPAAAYLFDGVNDNVALTWEQGVAGQTFTRVWLRME